MHKPNADYLMRRAMGAGITDPVELANFMGQMQVESGGFAHLEENLRYSGPRLLSLFRGRNGIDDIATANRLAAGGAEAVGNAIYGGEWGKRHGNSEPGDGYKYHGRGFVQLTGRPQYSGYSRLIGVDLVNNPEWAAGIDNAATVAIAYWKREVVSHDAQRDTAKACHYINGGSNGLRERQIAVAEWAGRLERGYAETLGQATLPLARAFAPTVLHGGARGPAIADLQAGLARLGYARRDGQPLRIDGDFGTETTHAVEAFQRDRGLAVDGKVGPRTQQALRAATAATREAAPLPTAEAAPATMPGFDDPADPRHALFRAFREWFPRGTSEARLAQATAVCCIAGMRQPEDVAGIHSGREGKIHFTTNSLFAQMAETDLEQPAPSARQSWERVQHHDLQQRQSELPVQQAAPWQQQEGQPMRGPQRA